MSLIDDVNIYDDPIIFNKRKGTSDDPFKQITESFVVESDGKVLLTELPNKKERVTVTGGSQMYSETDLGSELSAGVFSVDYPNGVVYFDNSAINTNLTFTYLGEGVRLYPASRVWVQNDQNNILNAKDKFSDIDNLINEQKARVDTLISSTPQPSEVVDARVDRNGVVYTVLKDRLDTDQLNINNLTTEITNTHTDILNNTYTSLKDRLDAAQLEVVNAHTDASGNKFTSLSDRFNSIDSQIGSFNQNISSIQNSLTLKVNSSDFTGSNIVSMIEMTPSDIVISAEKINLNGAIGINQLDPTVYSAVNNAVTKSAINLTDTLPTSIALDTNGITAYTSDTTKYTRMNQNGLYTKGGAITIERSDGYQSVSNGVLVGDFSITGASPRFTNVNVNVSGYFYHTTSASPLDCDFFSFIHNSRFLKINLAMYGSSSSSGSRMSFWDWENLSNPLAQIVTYVTDPNDPMAIKGTTLIIDLGIPDGTQKGIYARLNTGVAGNDAYGRILRMWKEG